MGPKAASMASSRLGKQACTRPASTCCRAPPTSSAARLHMTWRRHRLQRLGTAAYRVQKQRQRTARAVFSAGALSGACTTHSAWDCSARASAARVHSNPFGAGASAVLRRRSLSSIHVLQQAGGPVHAARYITARLCARPSAAPARTCSSLVCSCHGAARLGAGAATSTSKSARRPRAHARSHTSSASWSSASLLSASPCGQSQQAVSAVHAQEALRPDAVTATRALPCLRRRSGACAARRPRHRG